MTKVIIGGVESFECPDYATTQISGWGFHADRLVCPGIYLVNRWTPRQIRRHERQVRRSQRWAWLPRSVRKALRVPLTPPEASSVIISHNYVSDCPEGIRVEEGLT